MVRRGAIVLLALLWGCPDEIGGGMGGVVTGLRAPTDLDGVPNGGSEIVLTWKDRAVGETGYRLEMNFGPFGTPIIGGVEYLPADATSFVYPAFPNSTYYFRVFAVTSVLESDPSEVIVVSTPDVPERPTIVGASPVSTTQFRVRWSDVSKETGYRIDVSKNEGETWLNGSGAGADAVESAVPGLPDTEYLVRVVAFNARGDSTPSFPARACTLSNLVTFAVASGSDTGTYSSYHITSTGVEHLSHFDVGLTNVLYTTGPAPTYTTTTVDAGASSTDSIGGDGTSIALDGAGKVHIAAHDQTNGRLRYITNASGSWVAKKLEPPLVTLPIGARPRIIWDASSGRIHIYFYATSGGAPVIQQVWFSSPELYFTPPLPIPADHATTFSLAVDPSGTRHLALVSPQAELWYLRETGIPDVANPAQSEGIPLPGSSSAPDMTTIAATGSEVHVLFHDASSGFLHHATDATGAWVTGTVDQSVGQDVGRHCAAAIHPPTGRLHVAYYDATNRDLKYARKDPGGVWVRKVLDAEGDVGSHASIAIDAAGVVHIAYRDETNRRLKIATGSP